MVVTNKKLLPYLSLVGIYSTLNSFYIFNLIYTDKNYLWILKFKYFNNLKTQSYDILRINLQFTMKNKDKSTKPYIFNVM